MTILKLTKANLKKEKNGCGIYKIYDSKKKLIYVGRASNGNIKHHLIQHFGSKKYSGAKFGRRSDNYYDIIILPKKQVKFAEKRLIKKLNPKSNRYLYVRGKSKRRKNG
jgi:excinuclease UvrABC nuclease subunit